MEGRAARRSCSTACGRSPSARYVMFHCADPMKASLDGADTLLREHRPRRRLPSADHPRLRDERPPLPVAHGAPLRLRVERQLGYKMAKYSCASSWSTTSPTYRRRQWRLLGRPRLRMVCGDLKGWPGPAVPQADRDHMGVHACLRLDPEMVLILKRNDCVKARSTSPRRVRHALRQRRLRRVPSDRPHHEFGGGQHLRGTHDIHRL